MTSRLTLKQEDVELFRRAVGDIVPLRQNAAEPSHFGPRRASRRARAEICPRDHVISRDEPVAESMRVSANDGIEFRKPGVQDRIFRKLRQGRFDIAGELDLHGMTVARAKLAFDRFMDRDNRITRQCCVRVIHGKGYRSKEGVPVIKHKIQAWLQAHRDVLAYCSCRQSDGGTGALYVLLKSTHG